MQRQQQQLILRLWKEWCRVWPEQYGHESLEVKPEGYDPVFDLVPSQAYKDFYFEVARGHPVLRGLSAFEIIDAALNQTRAPEMTVKPHVSVEPLISEEVTEEVPEALPEGAVQYIEPRIVEVELEALHAKEDFEEASNQSMTGS